MPAPLIFGFSIFVATIKSHLAKAEHNKALAEFLKGQSDYLDWQVVAIFYAALHKVQAMLRVADYAEMMSLTELLCMTERI